MNGGHALGCMGDDKNIRYSEEGEADDEDIANEPRG